MADPDDTTAPDPVAQTWNGVPGGQSDAPTPGQRKGTGNDETLGQDRYGRAGGKGEEQSQGTKQSQQGAPQSQGTRQMQAQGGAQPQFDSDNQPQTRQPGIEAEMSPAPDYMPRFPGAGRLTGKVALITGGDSGIGRATAILFAREGARVAIHYKDEHQDAEATLALIRDEGAEGMALHGDIGQRAEAERVVAEVTGAFGHINILVNNAAEQHAQEMVSDIPEAQLRRTFDTNLFAQFFLVQQVLPQMGRGDAIVNITSVTAFRGADQLIDYAASKGGILALTRALAHKLAPQGIRVNAVAPGPIWTPLIPASFATEKVESFGKDSPLGRPGQPCEVAPAILFLACEDSSYMTGQTLHPNGGEAVGS